MKIKLIRNVCLDGKSYSKDDIVDTTDQNGSQLIRMGKAIPSDGQNKSVGLKASKPKKKLEVKDESTSSSILD
jgi:hypothetical protein